MKRTITPKSQLKCEQLESRRLLAGVPVDFAYSLTAPAQAIAGSTLQVGSVNTNVGKSNGSALNTVGNFYLSKDRNVSADDIQLLNDVQGPIRGTVKPGDSFTIPFNVRIPGNTPAGNYFLIEVVRDVPVPRLGAAQQYDSNLANNTTSLPLRIDQPVVSQVTKLVAEGRTPGGLRGEKTTLTVRLVDASNAPLAGQTITFVDQCRYYRLQGRPNGERSLGSIVTDASGRAKLTYTIPSSVNVDNVSIIARFAGTNKLQASSCTITHVEIGRRS